MTKMHTWLHNHSVVHCFKQCCWYLHVSAFSKLFAFILQ